VPNGGVDLIVEMERITQLDTVPILATRTGVFGVVLAKAGYVPLAGATVRVMGAGQSAKTSGDGRFDLPAVKEGAYIVMIQHPLYQSRMISVFVPADKAVQLAAVLDSAVEKVGEKHLNLELRDFEYRARARGNLSAIIPRQEFAGRFGLNLKSALLYSPSFLRSGLVIRDEVTCVFVDGDPRPLWTLHDFIAADVLAIEVYGPRQEPTGTLQSRWPAGQPCGTSNRAASPGSSSKFGLQPHGIGSGREPIDNIARAVVIWTKR
jgi:hypothetical protein